MIQELRIHLPMQEMQVSSLVQEDPSCRGVIRPAHSNKRSHCDETSTHLD